MDATLLQVAASVQSSQGLLSSTHVANAVSEALRSCAITIPGKASSKATGGVAEVSGSPPKSPIESLYQAPQDVTAPPPTRRGTHYSRPRSAPTIIKRKVRKVTGGDDDDSGFSGQLPGGGDGSFLFSGGSGGSWGGSGSGGSGGSGGSSGGNWGGGNWGGRGGDRAGDESWGPEDWGSSIDWSRVSQSWRTAGRMNQRGLDALCALYYRSLCWISLSRCVHHVLTSQLCMVTEGMALGMRPSLARCSGLLESRLANGRMAMVR